MFFGIAGQQEASTRAGTTAKWAREWPRARRVESTATHATATFFLGNGSRGDACKRDGLGMWEGAAYPSSPGVTSGGSGPLAAALLAEAADGAANVRAGLAGPYRVALWHQSTNTLTLAVDPFAQMSLYYTYSAAAGTLAFASELDLLRSLDWVGSEPDDEVVVDMLLDRNWPSWRTPYRRIGFIPAGCRVTWRARDGLAPLLERDWTPRIGGQSYRSIDALLEAFRADTQACVTDRLQDAKTASALMLSGGYDSTAIAGVAAAVLAERGQLRPLRTVSAVFGTLPCDESARIARTRAFTGLAGIDIEAQAIGLDVATIERQVRASGYPLFNMQQRLLEAELDAARSMGCDNVLFGHGGDELATDTAYERDLFAAHGWWSIGRVARTVAPLRAAPASMFAVMRSLARERLPEDVKALARPMLRQLRRATPESWRTWLQPEWHRMAAAGVERTTALPDHGMALDGASHFQRAVWRNLQTSIAQYGRRTTLADVEREGLRCGTPLLDRRLFERVLDAHPDCLPRTHHAGHYKPLIADALGRYMETSLHPQRWKVEFGSYNRLVMTSALGELDDWMAREPWHSERFVPHAAARSMLATARATGCRDNALHRRLYSIIGLEAWLRLPSSSNTGRYHGERDE